MANNFGDQVRRFSRETEQKLTDAVQKIALDVFSETIMATPVDTGRLRGSWMSSISQPSGANPGTVDPSGGASVARASGVVEGAELGDVIYMVNNVEYALYVENGTARVAPRRMVGRAVQRAAPVAQQVIAQIAARG